MLSIDCLVKNTDFIDGVKKYVKYIGNEYAAEGKKASFNDIYSHLKKEGLEVDIETAGHIYVEMLPTETDDNFTSREDVQDIAGAHFDESIRNLILGKPKEGEQKIGDLSPVKQIVKSIAGAFSNNVVEDKRTKSTLRAIQDIYSKTLDRFTGDLPNKKPKEGSYSFEEKLLEGMEKMGLGHRNNETGLINNLRTLHDAAKVELNKVADQYEADGDPVRAAQFRKYIEHFQDATYSAALSQKEISKVVDDALAKNGFGKIDKNGKVVLDTRKLAGDQASTSAQKLRENVIDALVKSGEFDKDTAEIVSRDFQRKLVESTAKSLEILQAEQEKKAKSWEAPARAPKVKVEDIVADQVKRWDTYIQHMGMAGEKLILSKKTAADAMKHILVEAGLSRENKKGSPTLDLNALANHIRKPEDIAAIAKEYFTDQTNQDGTRKYTDKQVDQLSNAMDGMVKEMFNKVREHVEGKAKAIENTWNPDNVGTPPATFSETVLKRLIEWSHYKDITGKKDALLKFTQNEAHRLVGEILKNTEEYGRETSSGKRQIDWLKMAENRPKSIGDLAERHLIEKEGFSKSDAKEVANSLDRDYHGLLSEAITNHATAILEQKAKAIDRDAPERKSAIQRLAELNSLGAFDEGHEKLLYHFLDVDQANIEDLDALKEISGMAAELRTELGGRDYLGSFLFKNADRKISEIIERNKDDQARLSGIIRQVEHLYNLTNMGLIANPYNLIENNWSGLKAVIGANMEVRKQFGLGIAPHDVVRSLADGTFFKDNKLWWNTWKDVAIGGVDSGNVGDKFVRLGNFADNLNSVNIKKNPIKALKTLAILIPRAFLNASDAANKAVLAKKGMMLSMHQAMVAQGYSSEAATMHIAEALYGDKLKDAKVAATNLIDKYGLGFGVSQSKYARKRAIDRLASDMTIANLNISVDPNVGSGIPIVNEKVVEAAMASGLHAAAMSLGHEANNRLSKGISENKKKANKELNELFEDAKNTENPKDQNRLYNQYARKKLANNLYFNGILRMQSGAMNWAMLRADHLGWRLATKYGEGSALQTELNFGSKDELEKTMKRRIDAQRKITRSLTGLSEATIGLIALAGYGLFRTKDESEDQEEGVFQSAANGIKKSVMLNRSVMKFAPDLVQLYYLGLAHKGEGFNKSALAATSKYAQGLMNANPAFTPYGHIAKGTVDIGREQYSKGLGQFGAIVGGLTDVPFYKTGKGYYQIVHHLVTDQEIQAKYPKNNTLVDGAFGGGLIEDIIVGSGIFSDETLREWGMGDWIVDKGAGESF